MTGFPEHRIGEDMKWRLPYLRLFPIWRYGQHYANPWSERPVIGWYPDRFGSWEFDTEEEALAEHKRLKELPK